MEMNIDRFSPQVQKHLPETLDRLQDMGDAELLLLVGGKNEDDGTRTSCRFLGSVSPMSALMLLASSVRATQALLTDAAGIPDEIATQLVVEACKWALASGNIVKRAVGQQPGIKPADGEIPDNVIDLASAIIARMKKDK